MSTLRELYDCEHTLADQCYDSDQYQQALDIIKRLM